MLGRIMTWYLAERPVVEAASTVPRKRYTDRYLVVGLLNPLPVAENKQCE